MGQITIEVVATVGVGTCCWAMENDDAYHQEMDGVETVNGGHHRQDGGQEAVAKASGHDGTTAAESDAAASDAAATSCVVTATSCAEMVSDGDSQEAASARASAERCRWSRHASRWSRSHRSASHAQERAWPTRA